MSSSLNVGVPVSTGLPLTAWLSKDSRKNLLCQRGNDLCSAMTIKLVKQASGPFLRPRF